MNNNINCDYIGAIGSYPIIDYVDNTSNILDNKINITSNILDNKINITSNILSNNIINVDNKYNLVYPYNSNSLINIKVDEYLNSNVYINNPFNLGKIYFKTTNPISTQNLYTRIDYDNKLYVYFPGSLLPPKFPEWWCVEEKLSSIFDNNTAQDTAIAGLGLAINEVWDAVGIQQGQISQLQLFTLLDTANTRIALAVNGFTLAQNILTGATAITIAISSFALGMALYINNNYVSTNLLNQITSNLDYTNEERSNLSNAIILDQYSNCLKISSNSCNLNILNGFINSNIITTQYINSINTNEIKMNNLNFSNIFVTSNVLNTTSNILSNYTFNSSNNLINNIIFNSNINFNYTFDSSNILNNKINNNSNVITYNNSNLLFNTNYTVERPYPPKLYNSSTSQSVVTYLNQNPTYYETFTLTTADITYGSGTYEVRSSSIDDTTISFTGTGSSRNSVTGNTNYDYIMFPNSGTFTINNNLICDILVVGGGGGGGGFGGGGGAGAILFAQNYTIPSGTHTITVGTGGAGAPTNTNGTNGNNSSITINGTSYIAVGGGGGGSRIESGSPLYGRPGNNGGSGGGGAHSDGVTNPQNNLGGTSTKNTYSGWTSYGNSGGNGKNGDYAATGYGSGGGGGAGSIGTNAGNNSGGNGGTGINMNSYFGSVVGNNGWFGGGGGGGSYSGRSGYINGYGNGGNGNYGGGGNAFSVNGLANTGGGGGGADYNNMSGNGGTGGSGVVIIRFLTPTITTKKELFNLITNDSGCTFKTNQYDITNGNYLTTDRYINNYYGDWVIIKKPNPIYLIKYQIYNRPSFIERSPSLFKIFASTDGITYDEITEASNTTPLTTSNYSSGYFEKIVNYYSKAYSYFALVVNKIVGGNINAHMLNFTEFKIFGKEFKNYTPIYASSNAVKDIVLLDMPRVNKKSAFYCTTTNVIYPNGGDIPYYAYHIDLRNYTQTGFIQIGSQSGDPYRVFNIKCFFGSCYFQRLINNIPDIVDYTIYMSYKANSSGGDTKNGLNIMATGIPQCYYLDTITPNRIFLLRNAFNDFNYISVVTTSSADVRVFIEDMLN